MSNTIQWELIQSNRNSDHLQTIKKALGVYSVEAVLAEIERLKGLEHGALLRLVIVRDLGHNATHETIKALYAGEEIALLSILSGSEQPDNDAG